MALRFVLAQAVSRRPVTMKVIIQFQANSRGLYGGKIRNRTGFLILLLFSSVNMIPPSLGFNSGRFENCVTENCALFQSFVLFQTLTLQHPLSYSINKTPITGCCNNKAAEITIRL